MDVAKPPPPDPTYFLDENLDSPDFESALAEVGMRCVRISCGPHPFRKGMLDPEWIPLVAARGWWGVTFDVRTRNRPAEIGALRESGAVHIIIQGKKMTMQERAKALVLARFRLVQRIPPLVPPVIAFVFPDGRVEFDGEPKRRAGVKK